MSIVVLSHVQQLWPRQDVVKVVLQNKTLVNTFGVQHGRAASPCKIAHLQLIVLGQTKQIASLHRQQIIDCGRSNADHGLLVSEM